MRVNGFISGEGIFSEQDSRGSLLLRRVGGLSPPDDLWESLGALCQRHSKDLWLTRGGKSCLTGRATEDAALSWMMVTDAPLDSTSRSRNAFILVCCVGINALT
eukprot:scaffold1663_cov171-Amphora_coffeaeformis.AAC.11